MFVSALLPLIAATAVVASPVTEVKRNNGGAAVCKSFYADITASAMNYDYNAVTGGAPANQQVLVESSISQFRAGSNVAAMLAAAPMRNVSGTYSMWFEYCAPTNGAPRGIFQAHHGLVGNAGYWNVRLDNGRNSFAESAAAAGWATLAYDRLGVGRSAHPDGLQTVQINYEIAQSAVISRMLRAGQLSDLGAFNKIVGVGHSYGSIMMAGIASVAPTVFDALVLTGFTSNVTMGPLGLAGFMSTIANVAYPARFASLPNSYVITPTVSNDQLGFFHYPNYTQAALDQFTTTKGEYTLGQQNSIGGPYALNRTSYTRPTFIITGDYDAPFCAANCSVTSLGAGQTQLDTARMSFPSVPSANFSTYVVKDTAHGINFHTTAYTAYQQIIGFVQKVGLN